jgi:YidC/Oxa1 family membrane protein insertase
MGALFSLIAKGLGVILHFLYTNLWFNYGLAIIVLTVILKVVLLPLAVKSFKSMAKTSEIQPIIAELQRKYKNDKEALNKEIMKVYQEKKVNPLGGCLPLLIQIPILYGLFLLISHPLTYVLNDQNLINSKTYASYISAHGISKNDYYNELKFIDKIQKKEIDIVKLKNDFAAENAQQNSAVKVDFEKITQFNLYFAGINLGDIPKFIPTNLYQVYLWLLPLLSGITTYLSSKYGTMPTPGAEENPMQKQMLIMMPIMAAYFSFIVPAGLSLYWLVGNLFQMVQQKYLIEKYAKPKEV